MLIVIYLPEVRNPASLDESHSEPMSRIFLCIEVAMIIPIDGVSQYGSECLRYFQIKLCRFTYCLCIENECLSSLLVDHLPIIKKPIILSNHLTGSECLIRVSLTQLRDRPKVAPMSPYGGPQEESVIVLKQGHIHLKPTSLAVG